MSWNTITRARSRFCGNYRLNNRRGHCHWASDAQGEPFLRSRDEENSARESIILCCLPEAVFLVSYVNSTQAEVIRYMLERERERERERKEEEVNAA